MKSLTIILALGLINAAMVPREDTPDYSRFFAETGSETETGTRQCGEYIERAWK